MREGGGVIGTDGDAVQAVIRPVSFGRRITDLAAERPDDAALVFVATTGAERAVSWSELDVASNRAAHRLGAAGVDESSLVVVALPNCVDHIVATLGAWKVGACVLPLRWDLPDWERNRVLAVAEPRVAVAEWDCPPGGLPVLSRDDLGDPRWPATPLPDVVARPARSIATSGSTGTPKVIVANLPGEGVPGSTMHNPSARYLGYRPGQVQLIPAPLYHTNGFLLAHSALFEGQRIIVMERFDPVLAVDLIEQHRVNVLTAVTIMLQRMLRLPDIDDRDLSSIESVLHGGAPLPQWVARRWIELVGPEHFFVAYGSSENAGAAVARGDDWLAHPGTVGRPFDCEVKIVGPEGVELAPGEVGEIHMRWIGQTDRSFAYRGAEAQTRDDLFSTVGDLGWLDDDGYLYLAERRKDLIISGGSNVYAAEVEAALSEHPAIEDCVVVGIPDDEWGQRVHAVVQLASAAMVPSDGELRLHCRDRLAPYKVPKSIERVDRISRSDAGKVRRSDYAGEAEAGR